MPVSKETVLTLIEQGDVEGVFRCLKGASEKERAPLAKHCAREYRVRWNASFDEAAPTRESIEAAKIATLATARLAEFKTVNAPLWLSGDHDLDIIAERPRRLIQGLAEWLVEDDPRQARSVLTLMEEGLCEKPEHENFLLGLMEIWGHSGQDDGGLALTLRSHADFLAGDLWRLLTIEGAGEFSLGAHDKYSVEYKRWDNALVLLANDGSISRDRLLDSTLDILVRDFAQFRAGWYSRLHEALKPTLDERVPRMDGYLRLLGSTVGPTVTFALKALAKLEKAGRLDGAAVMEHIEPALSMKTKSAATLALRLLESAGKGTNNAGKAGRLAAVALMHEAADIQSRALDTIERLGAANSDDVREALLAALDFVAPSVRDRLAALVGTDPQPREESVSHPIASASEARDVRPVRDLDDLVLRFAYVLENPEEVEEIEQVLGGLSLLCPDRPERWKHIVSPLAKRAAILRERVRESGWDLVQHDLACLALTWTEGTKFAPDLPMSLVAQESPCTGELFRERLTALADRVHQGQPLPLLSCPTHPRGIVDPTTLVERALAWADAGRKPDVPEALLSLLRLGAEGREPALEAASSLRGEFAEALRYALGADKVKVGRSAPLWIAAARARDSQAAHPLLSKKHKRLGPDGIEPVRYALEVEEYGGPEYQWFRAHLHRTPKVPKRIPALHPTVMFHAGRRGRYPGLRGAGACGFHASLVRWSALIAPGDLEGYFSVAVERIDVDWSEVQWEVRHFFEPMLEPTVWLGPTAHLFLALGLAAKEPGQHGMAVDVLVTTAEDGRLDTNKLGEWMGRLLPSGLVKARRWAQTLSQAAGAGSVPATAVRSLFQASLRGEPSEAPRDLSYLLDSMHEVFVEGRAQVTDDQARQYLGGISKGGKTGKLCRALLALCQS